MEKHNTVHAIFASGEKVAEIKDDVWQYDFGQVLQISGLSLPPVVEVHYANKGKDIALPQTGVTEGGITTAPIPNEILEEKGSFTAYIFVTDGESGETCYTINGYVNKRPRVKGFNAPEDQEILHAAVGAVNAAAERAESAEAKATEAAKQTAEDAQKTGADRAETERLVESVSGIGEQVTKVENLTEQAQTSATNAALSEQAAKTAETNAQAAQAGAETAEGNAELAEQNAKKSEQAVEQAKQLVMQMGQEVLDNKNHVDQTVQAFDQTAQQAVADVNNAGQTQTERVQSAGNTAVESIKTAQGKATQAIETAKTEAINVLQAEGTTQTGNVSAEGAKQVQAVQQAAQEIMADREQIAQNKADVTTLKEDIGNSNILYNNILQIKNTINMLNPNELKIGKIIDPNGKVVNGSENRSTSELINVDSSIKLRVTTAFNQTLFQYDNIGNMLAYTNTFNSSNPIDLDTNTKYIRICVWNDTMPFMLYQSDGILSYIDYGKYSENVRGLVNIHISDTEEEIYLKLYDACNKGNCDIYWEYGTYEFSTIFELIKTKYKRATAYELPIGGNCRYFFNGSTVIGTGISSDSNVINNSSIFGTWRKSQSYELYDGIFIANHLIYCVHEEASSSSIPYRTKYHNLRMFHNTVTDDYDTTIGLRKCIGGGTGLHPNIEVSNCYFQTDHGRDIGWHGHNSDDKTTFYINIHNCYFSHGIANDSMSTNETAELIFNGNSTPIIPTTNHNGVKGWKVFAWNNEKRSN